MHAPSSDYIEGDVPNGLGLIPHFLNPPSQEHVKKWFAEQGEWAQSIDFPDLDECHYCDDELRVFTCHQPVAQWMKHIGGRLKRMGIFEQQPDHFFAIRYPLGTGVSGHIDDTNTYGDTIAGLSLDSSSVLSFLRVETGERARLLLPPGSLYVLQGEARTEWGHGIAEFEVDDFKGTEYPRSERISLTFRNLRRNLVEES